MLEMIGPRPKKFRSCIRSTGHNLRPTDPEFRMRLEIRTGQKSKNLIGHKIQFSG